MDKADGKIKSIINTFYTGSDSFAGVPRMTNLLTICHKIVDDVELSDSDIDVLKTFESTTTYALTR